jgi:predicted SnoaL-like aldol condensation-catalyzing enzyme
MSTPAEQENKAIVAEAFNTLFNRHDYAAAEHFFSPDYVQHSAHIPPGREGLFGLVRSLPPTLRHETERMVAEGDWVMVRGRFSGHGQPAPWIVVDTLRMTDGVLAEHWDVIEDEATRHSSVSGAPMFGDAFPGEN